MACPELWGGVTGCALRVPYVPGVACRRARALVVFWVFVSVSVFVSA